MTTLREIAPYEIDSLKNFRQFAPRCLSIIDINSKKGRDKLIPFNLNHTQIQYLDELEQEYELNGRIRHIILKSRKRGISTLACAKSMHSLLTEPYFVARHYLQKHAETKTFGRIYKKFYDNLPKNLKLGNAKVNLEGNVMEIGLPAPLNTGMICMTAGGGETTSRGDTFDFAHVSEFAFYAEQKTLFDAITDCVPFDSGYIIIESTPNRAGDLFHTLFTNAMAGENNYRAFFFPWYEDPRNEIHNDETIELSDEETELVKRYNLTVPKIKWRRFKIKEYVSESGSEGRRIFRREFPEDPDSCFLSSQFAYFDAEIILWHIAMNEMERKEEKFKEERGSGNLKDLRIFNKPKPDGIYSIGFDTSEGKDKGDFDSATCWDDITGEEMATLRGKWGFVNYAEKLNDFGRMYNEAQLVGEANNHGFTVLTLLYNNYDYPNLYRDRKGSRRSIVGDVPKYMGRFGIYTSGANKKPILDSFAMEMGNEEHDPTIFPHDDILLRECLNFEEYHGILSAPEGKYDDVLMGASIGRYCKQSNRSTLEVHNSKLESLVA